MTPREKLEKVIDEKAFEWVKKDDGSLGHCPECFKAGANLLKEDVLELCEALKRAINWAEVDADMKYGTEWEDLKFAREALSNFYKKLEIKEVEYEDD